MTKNIYCLVLAFAILSIGCKNNELIDPHPVDPHSFSNSKEAVTKHLDLDLEVDFESRIMSGVAKWTVENKGAKRIVFDARDLKIEKVTAGVPGSETEAEWFLGDVEKHLGQPLVIEIAPEATSVSIFYKTSPDAAALLWIEKEQTLGKQYPFLFTQGQPVLTRSWIPCQDSPGIRVTYDASIKVPPGMMALMSAVNPQQKDPRGQYRFSMPYAVSPYLIAMAVGDLAFHSIGKRAGVYAEPPLLDDALYEFDKVPEMMEVTEQLYGPYAWGRYDILVLPPSFPYGGMENPMLTFATPTLIAGDRSLTTTIAHELAHSWSGNLVTNASWDDFWLNEGFTVYMERRIIEALEGRPFSDMVAEIGYQDLVNDLQDLKPEDTHLRLRLAGRDPDDGSTNVAYEKGGFFLEFIEEKVGREKFDSFLKKYFSDHRFQAVSTDDFITYLNKNLFEELNIHPDINEWIDGSGIPESCRKVNSVRFRIVDRVVEQVKNGENVLFLGINGWSAFEKVHFIRHLPRDLEKRTMQRLDYTYHFSDSKNAEIQAAWYELSIYNGYSDEIMEHVEEFLIRVGRRKFLMPIYRAFVKSEKMEAAQKIYEKVRPGYHSVSTGSLDELLGK